MKRFKNIFRCAGAFVAWVIGSGFATGQEVLQFFTSYGYKSYAIILINLVGFLVMGVSLYRTGQKHKDVEGFSHFTYLDLQADIVQYCIRLCSQYVIKTDFVAIFISADGKTNRDFLSAFF